MKGRKEMKGEGGGGVEIRVDFVGKKS